MTNQTWGSEAIDRIFDLLSERQQEQQAEWVQILKELGEPIAVGNIDDRGQFGVWVDDLGVFTLRRMGPDHLWEKGSLMRYDTNLIKGLYTALKVIENRKHD